MAKKRTKAPENPVVAVAHKLIPRSYSKKMNRWIKAHKRTIFMTASLMSALYFGYMNFKKGVDRATKREQALIIKTQKLGRAGAKKLRRSAGKLDLTAERLQSDTIFFGTRVEMENERAKVASKALNDSGFKDYLKKKGYTNVRKVKK
jgi:hypothetical protein